LRPRPPGSASPLAQTAKQRLEHQRGDVTEARVRRWRGRAGSAAIVLDASELQRFAAIVPTTTESRESRYEVVPPEPVFLSSELLKLIGPRHDARGRQR
jgi:hypothetical protein